MKPKTSLTPLQCIGLTNLQGNFWQAFGRTCQTVCESRWKGWRENKGYNKIAKQFICYKFLWHGEICDICGWNLWKIVFTSENNLVRKVVKIEKFSEWDVNE